MLQSQLFLAGLGVEEVPLFHDFAKNSNDSTFYLFVQ
jgi:hypothetical protein